MVWAWQTHFWTRALSGELGTSAVPHAAMLAPLVMKRRDDGHTPLEPLPHPSPNPSLHPTPNPNLNPNLNPNSHLHPTLSSSPSAPTLILAATQPEPQPSPQPQP